MVDAFAAFTKRIRNAHKIVEIMLQVQILSPNSIEDQKKTFTEN